MAQLAVGVDIGGTGIKGAIVDVESGALTSDRIKKATPEGGKPDDIAEVVVEIINELGMTNDEPIGICFPAVVKDGRTMSAANVSKKWIGFPAEELFEKRLGRQIHFVNDADAAGFAEQQFGAAKGVDGLVIMTTLGTGIGTALINDGVLIVNAELGHIEIDGVDYETKASYAAKERDDLSWKHWAKRLQKYYSHLEAYLSPELFVVGGGISKQHEEFLPLLDLQAKIIPATLRNNAGIIGAAKLAADSKE
ncbi:MULTISPECIES: polyphosphate--glucose phosphotransferase [unclassified Curtobacterium]|uniref:polyphosphate--glucose phosphotransferase n=1 Tax=unclassified Curtobacterium TaxID=257496 RepID=UPI000DA761FE|nr:MULTISPECIES: ROK family protein [unclassified Curtobacterium]PZE29847.1 ROK family protein [Curtobacterium sp. MCBD17_028]PZE75749.1 ROK family protein [Curtobacterium sp. MCBD17_019]PZF60890.1 ROK family protein [Curtobacterium sp. MCBD17_034]PZF66373.1 ROK family protein [Curtobacterium sp. MCBD17_013]PZM40239.1 ROK family protein [Curtobacterium sp. MCBD17_031]